MGIGGSGISGVAKLSENMGHTVSGCDLEESTAYADNVFKGHSSSHITGADLVIVSPAILFQDPQNPELVEAKNQGKLMTWQAFLGEYLVKGKKVICIAGTHGKSTTVAMAGKLLIDAGFDPSIVLGANVLEWKGTSRPGNGDYFVVEADEFNDNFLSYNPEIIILNNIEFDHPDYFESEERVLESFEKFIGKLVGERTLIVNWEDGGVQKLSPQALESGTLVKVRPSKDGFGLKLKIPGEYNISNAAMVWKLGVGLGIKEEVIKKSLESFSGIGRRSEMIFNENGIEIYDDYAHHPTAIAATLSGMRKAHPAARIWAIDEPHGFVRTNALIHLYKGVFDDADKVLIGPIFKARDREGFGMTSEKVALATEHRDAVAKGSFEEIRKILEKELKEGDVVVVMGAGKSYLWAREIAKMLKEEGGTSLKVVEDKSFRDLTTFRIGGKIKYYIEVKSDREIEKAVCFAKKRDLPVFIIGGGSDILIGDCDFNGVALKYIGDKVEIKNGVVTAQAGKNWDELVSEAVAAGLWGIECLSGIPGSVGASPIQNIGAYGQELKNVFVSLVAYDIENQRFVRLNKESCKFSYRESIFKRADHWQKYIITEVTLKLTKNGKPRVRYDSLKKYLVENNTKNPTLQEVRDAVLTIRAGKFENPKEVGNAGSFFKNPVLDSQIAVELMKKYEDIPARLQKDGKYKSSAAWFIEKAGWKGKTFKGAGVSPRHALVLINPKGEAKASDLIELSDKIIEDVADKFGVKLEREVQVINFKGN